MWRTFVPSHWGDIQVEVADTGGIKRLLAKISSEDGRLTKLVQVVAQWMVLG
jgi:hypothetical protein